ncbi:MAG: hypothetical protein IT369_12440 [Candidatus Latescibacteria bacterium]|nr:hypothetical protein [Candidatus Latescibacterota bacterium]
MEVSLFGAHHRPPEPPRREQWVMVLVALLIAVVLTLSYFGVIYLAEQGNQ